MKRLGKQSKEITLKRIRGDEFQFAIEAGYYYVNGKETGILINTAGSLVLFDSFDEYGKADLDINFWEEQLWHTNHETITSGEALALYHVVDELLHEVNTGVNQLYIDDETWIDGLFELVI